MSASLHEVKNRFKHFLFIEQCFDAGANHCTCALFIIAMHYPKKIDDQVDRASLIIRELS